MPSQQQFKPNYRVPKTCYYFPIGGPLPPDIIPGRDGPTIVTSNKPALGGQTWLEEGAKFPEDFEGGRVVTWLMPA